MVVEGLGLDSDEELEVDSDLEDNFVELAGGHAVEDEDTDQAQETHQPDHPDRMQQANSREMLAQDKVLMIERFLYGDNERERQGDRGTATDDNSDDEQFSEPDEATILNRQFEKVNTGRADLCLFCFDGLKTLLLFPYNYNRLYWSNNQNNNIKLFTN